LSRIFFVTGTDTGVGKTLLTALLLQHFRTTGVRALAMKPFCSGGRADVNLLQELQGAAFPADFINPFYFPEPVAPLVAARALRRKIRLRDAVDAIHRVGEHCDCVLVEGSGGVLVPLGENFDVRDLIEALRCETIVVARNKLGTINHTRLTIEALQARGLRRICIALMEQKSPDASARTNETVLRGLLPFFEIVSVRYLGSKTMRIAAVKSNAKKLKKTLARLSSFANVRPFFGTRPQPGASTVRLKTENIVDSRRSDQQN
jgi:dethiobiotin synthetase